MTVTLKPCPFCAATDAFTERSDFSSSYGVCNNCLARGPVACQDDDGEDEPGQPAAIKAWNTRPEPSPLPDGLVERLHSAIKHGDQDHQDWLLEAIGAFFVGQPIPEPRGKGNKEAEITRLQADNADLRALLETGREYAIEAANDCGAKDEMFDQIMRDIGRMDDALQSRG